MTPTCSDFACKNAGFPNAGSSATDKSSAVTSPLKMFRCKLPSFTCRPSAEDKSASSAGRNWSTLMKNGRLIAITSTAASPIPVHFKRERKRHLLPRVYSSPEAAFASYIIRSDFPGGLHEILLDHGARTRRRHSAHPRGGKRWRCLLRTRSGRRRAGQRRHAAHARRLYGPGLASR